MQEMLQSKDFPYEDVLTLVMKKVKSSNKSAVKSMLSKQRAAVLAKVTIAIKEISRKKSEKER